MLLVVPIWTRFRVRAMPSSLRSPHLTSCLWLASLTGRYNCVCNYLWNQSDVECELAGLFRTKEEEETAVKTSSKDSKLLLSSTFLEISAGQNLWRRKATTLNKWKKKKRAWTKEWWQIKISSWTREGKRERGRRRKEAGHIFLERVKSLSFLWQSVALTELFSSSSFRRKNLLRILLSKRCVLIKFWRACC